VSWRVLLEDLLAVCQQVAAGQDPQLPPKTTSFKQWATALTEYARSEAVRSEAAFWLEPARAEVEPLPVDFPDGANTVASIRGVTVLLSEEETQALLQEVPEVYHTQINDVLLTALAQAFANWNGAGALLVDLEGHGREEELAEADLTRTVGWFTTIFPVRLTIDPWAGPGETLKAVKEQLRTVPKGGIGYGLLRYLSGDEGVVKALNALPRAEVSFNYLGQLDRVLPHDGPLARAPESPGPVQGSEGLRPHLLAVVASVAKGRLRLHWTYSANVHRQETVEMLAQGLQESLQSVIAHCRTPEAGGFTPSDFPEADLSQDDLDKLLRKINPNGGNQGS